jgi:citrate lyase subunit beta/citryl-CoA lyase
MARRSVLFSPGDEPEMMYNAPETGADAVVFDLEDAVAPDRKDAARAAVADVLSDPAFDPDCEVCVRLNPDSGAATADVEAIAAVDPRLDAVVVPKAESADDVRRIEELLGERDIERPIVALCESAQGVLSADGIAAADPVVAVALGAEDLAADIGATRTERGEEIAYARQRLVVAAGAAGVDAIDTPRTEIGDPKRLAEETAAARRLGYDGKLAIHPDQVDVINEAFTPDSDEVAWAERVLAATDDADGGVVRVDDEMIDAPLIERAKTILDRHRAATEDG